MPINLNELPKPEKMQAPVLPIGNYPARLVQVIDLGLQLGYQDKPTYKVWMTYELVDEFMVDEEGKELTDKPRWISEELAVYPPGTERAKSTERLLALDPGNKNNGDLAAMVGSPCNVSLGHNPNKKNPDRPYEKVQGLSAVREKDAKKMEELKNDSVVFDLANPDLDVFNSLPQFLQDKITSNLEFQGSKLQQLVGGEAKKPVEVNEEEAPW